MLSEESKALDVESSDMRGSTAIGRDVATEQPRLQLFYSDHDETSRNVAGFGWMNDS